jgi:DNA (cytosine-5)-methyltransferase 1
MDGIVLFSGGGGVERGMQLANVSPIISVENDPSNSELSRNMRRLHRLNFPDCLLLPKTIQQAYSNDLDKFPKFVDFLHASPVCSNFSNASRHEKAESKIDLECAKYVCRYLEYIKPSNFTLEQVPGYLKSQSFKMILECLKKLKYDLKIEVINFKDYGLPQSRKRLIVRASIGKIKDLIPQPEISWYSAIGNLIPLMNDAELTEKQKEAVKTFYHLKGKQNLFVDRIEKFKNLRIIAQNKPINTLTKSYLSSNGITRNNVANIVTVDGIVKNVSLKALAKLQGFDRKYKFLKSNSSCGAIIGYSVPPIIAKQLFEYFY